MPILRALHETKRTIPEGICAAHTGQDDEIPKPGTLSVPFGTLVRCGMYLAGKVNQLIEHIEQNRSAIDAVSPNG